jgi:hypothetical protein
MIVRKKKVEIIKSPNKTCDQLITMSYISILILVMNHYLKPLYITINVNDVLVYRVLVNNIVTLNIMSLTLVNKIGCNRVDMIPSKMLMSDFVKGDDQEFETQEYVSYYDLVACFEDFDIVCKCIRQNVITRILNLIYLKKKTLKNKNLRKYLFNFNH